MLRVVLTSQTLVLTPKKLTFHGKDYETLPDMSKEEYECAKTRFLENNILKPTFTI